MAQRNIALEITLGGVTQVVSDLKEFEELLKDVNGLLANLDKGSEAFQKLSGEVETATKQFNALKKTSDPKFYENAFKNFAKVGSTITASFAGAQAAINLFGGDATRVSEAAAEAQNLLTLALAARQAAEGLTAIKSAANTVTTLAEAAAAETASAATKKFYTVLAANPYGALLVAVGAVLGVLSLLVSRTDEAAKKQQELADATNKAASTEIAKLNILKATIEDETASRDARLGALEELQKMFPDYFANLDDEKILAGELTIEYDKLTDALIRKAKADALSGEVGRLTLERFNLEKNLIQVTNERIAAEENLDNVTRNAASFGQGAAAALQAASARLTTAKKEEQAAIDAVNENRQLEGEYIQEINKYTQENTGITTNNTEGIEENVGANDALIQAYERRLGLQNELLASLTLLNETENFASPELIERAKKLLAEATNLAKTRADFFRSETTKLVDDIDNLLFAIIPTDEQLAAINDIYLKYFTELLDTTKNGGVKVVDAAGNILEGFQRELDLKGFSEEQQKALRSFFARFQIQAEELAEGFTIADVVFGFGTEAEVQNKLRTLLDKTETILKTTPLPGLRTSKIREAVLELFEIPEKTVKDFVTTIDTTGEVGYAKWNEGIQTLTNNLIEFGLVQSKQTMETKENALVIADLQARLGSYNEAFSKSYQLTEEQINKVSSLIASRLKQQPELINEVLVDLARRSGDIVERFGEDGVMKLFNTISSALGMFEGLTREQLEDLEKQLIRTRLVIAFQFGEPVAKIFDDLILGIQERLGELPTAAELEAQAAAKAILDIIQNFNAALGVLNQTFSLSFETQFDILEKRYKRITDGIIGDTEEANKKRLEAEKAYQNERAELEKRQAKLSLRISLAQAIANTAEAITRTYAQLGGSPFAIIAAAAIAALNATQVGLISTQLSQIDKYQRGGKIRKGQGGLVVGPSHEQGGVRFQGGGLELEGGEAVINRVSTVRYGELLSQINMSGGGKPIIQNNFDDSRIVEAIAKQRREPIRAFVVESDITAKQETRRRLEELSQI